MRRNVMVLVMTLVAVAGCSHRHEPARLSVSQPVRAPVQWLEGAGEAQDYPTARLRAEFDAMVRLARYVGIEYTAATDGTMNSEEATRYRLAASGQQVGRYCGGIEYGSERRETLYTGVVRVKLLLRPRVGMLSGTEALAACRRAVVEQQ